MKIRFVEDKKIIDEVQSLIGRSSDVSAAVAYWGKNSVEETRITQRKKGSTRILCDLFSGACNPYEVLKLLKCGVEVKTLDGMHAKVWVNRGTAIVGSANASANGLGFEGSKVPGNVEAGVVVRDVQFAAEVQRWFDEQWDTAKTVETSDVDDVRELWKRRTANANRLTKATLFGTLKSGRGSAVFKNVRVIAYWPVEPSEKTKEEYPAGPDGIYPYYEDLGHVDKLLTQRRAATI